MLFFGDGGLESNFFILKIHEISNSGFKPFYDYQLDHYLKMNIGEEEAFFNYVHDIITNRIKHFKRLDSFSKKYASGLVYTRKLEGFLGFLKAIDQWHKTQPIESVISDKDKHMRKKITHNRYIQSLDDRITRFDTFMQDFKVENQTGKDLAKLIVNI